MCKGQMTHLILGSEAQQLPPRPHSAMSAPFPWQGRSFQASLVSGSRCQDTLHLSLHFCVTKEGMAGVMPTSYANV